MSELHEEQLIRLADVPKIQWLPRRRGGKKIHISTLIRWSQNGLRGHKLETIRVGQARCTSEDALRRFFHNLSTPANERRPIRLVRKRLREIVNAERKASEFGV